MSESTIPPSPDPNATTYASSRNSLSPRTVQRIRSDLSLRSAELGLPQESSKASGVAHYLRSRLRALTRPRVLAALLLWPVVLWLLHGYLSVGKPASSSLPAPELSTWPDFPAASRRADDGLDSKDARYRPLVPLEPPSHPYPQLRPNRFTPPHCLESWFMNGETSCGKNEMGPEEKLDATWLWVNGSDPRWRDELEHYKRKAGVYSPEQHFRDFNELVYSMRSVLKSLQGHLRTFHLVLYDFAFDAAQDGSRLPSESGSATDEKLRVAQTPTWLDFSKLNASSATPGPHPELRYSVHSELYHIPTVATDGVTPEAADEAVWRGKALPSFNSMAIESRLGWVPGLAETSIALNDDFFMLRPHSVADFHSWLYGDVYVFDKGFYQQARPMLDKTRFNDAGETGALYHANHLLSQRFPRRRRPYVAHGPKVMSRNMHHEASIMFKDALNISTTRRFREMLTGHGDVQILWLLASLKVERWREALLWTYTVANVGGTEGQWGASARQNIRDLFDITEADGEVKGVEVSRTKRWTLERLRVDKTFDQMGWRGPSATKYIFSSLDGHMAPILEPGRPTDGNDKCDFNFERCLGAFWTAGAGMSADAMFKRFAFEQPACGDCLIMTLVGASGPLGLSAFFPPADATYTRPSGGPVPSYIPPPHLPLTPTWQEADFSLAAVMDVTSRPWEQVNLRGYTMQLLQRYLYVSGGSRSQFHMLKDPTHTRTTLAAVDKNKLVSVLGLNDNVESGEGEVKLLLNQWFGTRWPKPAPWERKWQVGM